MAVRQGGKGGKEGGGRGSGRGRGKGGGSDDDDDDDDAAKERRLFIKLDGEREKASATAIDDLWLIARTPDALHQQPLFARSMWHGIGSNGMLELSVVQPSPAVPLRSGVKCVALRGPNAADLLAQLDMLNNLMLPRSPPILHHLLSPSTSPPMPPLAPTYKNPPDIPSLLAETLARFRLNPEQEAVLRQVAAWLPGGASSTSSPTAPPVVLVHGVFGAGKSHLLVCVLSFLQRALIGAARNGKPIKVLLAAMTNVAVDNVLEGLIARAPEGSDPGVLRVGALRRISPLVLPHSTHGKLTNEDEAATRRELQRELQHCPPAERDSIQHAIAQIDSGRMRQRAQQIAKYSIVGATTAATGLPCLNGLKFDIVLLDESSQLTEPASLLPLARMQCERLLAVGDPMQLSPPLHQRTSSGRSPLTAPTHTTSEPPPTGDTAKGYDLTLTLFQRLALGGCTPIMLRAQYRCHPNISSLASRLFYSRQLSDGLGSEVLAPHARLYSRVCLRLDWSKCAAKRRWIRAALLATKRRRSVYAGSWARFMRRIYNHPALVSSASTALRRALYEGYSPSSRVGYSRR